MPANRVACPPGPRAVARHPDSRKKMGLFQQLKPDIPEADVVLGDEEGVADLDHPVPADVSLLELFGAGSGLLREPHDLLEHKKGISLVDLAIPGGVPEEDGGDLDVVGFCGGRNLTVHRERDGIVARGGVGVGRVLVGGGSFVPEGPEPG